MRIPPAAIAAVVIARTNDGPQLLSIYLIAYAIGTFLVSQALVELPVADDHHRPLLGLRGLLRRSPILASRPRDSRAASTSAAVRRGTGTCQHSPIASAPHCGGAITSSTM
jgi:hypothetical protein